MSSTINSTMLRPGAVFFAKSANNEIKGGFYMMMEFDDITYTLQSLHPIMTYCVPRSSVTLMYRSRFDLLTDKREYDGVCSYCKYPNENYIGLVDEWFEAIALVYGTSEGKDFDDEMSYKYNHSYCAVMADREDAQDVDGTVLLHSPEWHTAKGNIQDSENL